MKFKELSNLYQEGVELLEHYEFEAQENPEWANSSDLGKKEIAIHFKWVASLLNYLNKKHST